MFKIFRAKVLAREPIRNTILSMQISSLGKRSIASNEGNAIQGELSERRPIRIVLLDHHLLFRESLARLLAAGKDFHVVAECRTPSEALQILADSVVDVVLVEIGAAKEFISSARTIRYAGQFLAIARDADATGSANVLKRGASGIFRDSDSFAWLVQAIRLVADGEAWVDHEVIQLLAERYPQHEEREFATLTEKERTVLQGVIDGLSNRKIGGRIGISESTVKTILQRLFKKARVHTRSQLVRRALDGSWAPAPHGEQGIQASSVTANDESCMQIWRHRLWPRGDYPKPKPLVEAVVLALADSRRTTSV